MSQIVLGLATPHAPQVRLPFEGWLALKEKDETDTRIDFEGLRKSAKPGIEDEVSESRMRERYDACKDNLRKLGERLNEAQPDAIVILGDDQREQFTSDNMPMFCVYHGARVEMVTKGREDGREKTGSRTWSAPRLREIQRAADDFLVGPRDRPAEASLGAHLIGALRDAEFDVSASDRLRPGVGLGHAFALLYQHLLPGTEIPIVPLMVNTLYPPNQPTPSRCYALGRALSKAIQSWPEDKRIAVIASGGLSHTVIDEAFDHETLNAIVGKDVSALKALPREKLCLGTSEILNWVAAAGTLEEMTPHLIGDYIPAYRTAAGTGCGMGFVAWTA